MDANAIVLPNKLEPGATIALGVTRVRVLDVVYPVHPQTGRGLFRVHQPEVGLDYALKLFDLTVNAAPAIGREISALNKLRQPQHFPRAHGFARERNWATLLLDWMPGLPLTATFKTPPVDGSDVSARVRVLQELCRVVDLVHRTRLLHRDLKPDNVLYRRGQREPELALIDFGLTAEARGAYEGTLGFQAPEQCDDARNMNLGPGTDVYALGQIGFWLLSGQPRVLYPNYTHSDWYELEAGQLLRACPHVRPQLEAVLLRALAFAPARRPRSALDLRKALGEALTAR